MKNPKLKYMHTMNGQPAYFDEKMQQIFFAHGRSAFAAVKLVDSVKQIHRNERISAKSRKKEGLRDASKWTYRWASVLIP